MNYCSHCGQTVQLVIPDGDNRPRHVCSACGTIHYQNPKMVVGCLPIWNDQLLLCRRAIEPRYGLWTLPAGFMENAETAQQGAARETREEANARVEVLSLFAMINLPHISQVYLMFLAQLLDDGFHPGTESLETRLFAEADIPWNQIAFPVVKECLRLYFSDRAGNGLRMHAGSVVRIAENPRTYITSYHQ